MKVLYFGSSKRQGLLSFQAVAAKHLSKLKEIDLTVMAGCTEQSPGLFELLKVNNVRYIALEGIDEIWNYHKNIIRFLKIVRDERYDVIHAQTNAHLAYCLIAKILFRTKIVYTIHYFRNDKPVKKVLASAIMSLMFNTFVDTVISTTSYVQNYFKRYRASSVLLPLGCEPDTTIPVEKPEHLFIMVYVAQFRPGKNHLWLLNALMPLIASHPDMVLYLPGTGELLASCQQLVEDAGLQDRILFPGYLSRREVAQHLSRAHLAVIASESETFGFCIVEPMFFSVPVISTDVGIAADVITNDHNGFVMAAKDAELLREKVRFLYENRETAKLYGERCREIVERKLSWDAIAADYQKTLLAMS